MRQVMPHRNNIGADCRRCKPFLHPMRGPPPNSRYCGIPVRAWSQRNKRKYRCHINDIKRYSGGPWTMGYYK